MRKFFFKRALPLIRENVQFNVNADTKPGGTVVVSIQVRILGIQILNETLTV